MKLTLHIINIFTFHSEVLGQIRGTLGEISWIGLAVKFLKNYLLINLFCSIFFFLNYWAMTMNSLKFISIKKF